MNDFGQNTIKSLSRTIINWWVLLRVEFHKVTHVCFSWARSLVFETFRNLSAEIRTWISTSFRSESSFKCLVVIDTDNAIGLILFILLSLLYICVNFSYICSYTDILISCIIMWVSSLRPSETSPEFRTRISTSCRNESSDFSLVALDMLVQLLMTNILPATGLPFAWVQPTFSPASLFRICQKDKCIQHMRGLLFETYRK